ncbi:MAG: LON peptidase substrate-binding domain-containing protein, partial [Gemmatimonadetes bacterium]|nr:LON peptidase substrate-binding domain-containing protein [Gemmatimonadota bacterium]
MNIATDPVGGAAACAALRSCHDRNGGTPLAVLPPMERIALIPVQFVPFPGTIIQLRLSDDAALAPFQDCRDQDRALGFIFHDEARFGTYRVEEGGVGCTAMIRALQDEASGGPRVIAQTLARFEIADALVVDGPLLEA